MSADVFISYRHGITDSWIAGRLHDRLEGEFAVYFDTNRQANDFGDDFAEGIDEALASCRVVLAIIGKDWTSPDGMRRLNQPDDWVRRELRIALENRDRVRVVPLFAGSEKMPDLSGVPEDLRALAGKNAYPLNPDLWDIQAQQIVSRLKGEWLTVRRGAARTAITVPPVLPYLCNRREQEDSLVELLQPQALQVPIACVVHGHKQEAHTGFLDRLRDQRALEDILDAREVGLAVHPLQLNHDRLRQGRFRDALVSALKLAALQRRAAPDDELRTFLMRLPQPLIAVVQLIAGDMGEDAATLSGLVSAWRALALGEPGGPQPMLPYAALLWINVSYDDDDTTVDLETSMSGVSLPRLQPIETVHVREWLDLDSVKPLVGERSAEVESLLEDSRFCIEPGRMHMQRFADGVRGILTRS